MSNFFDAVDQIYQLIQVSGVTMLLDGRIYQNRFPKDGEKIGEGSEKFICINNMEPRNGQITKDVPINIQVFCKELELGLIDQESLDNIEKAIETALDNPIGVKKVGYYSIEKVFSTVLPENPYSKLYSLMVIRLILTINTK